ncbi:MucR family transcriptional regulator [Yoonia sp.]|uniref:MucR family transcriptional regulator n=1 Tax=Yoonia sp. TaxID=2212373 RepID=UPI003974E763
MTTSNDNNTDILAAVAAAYAARVDVSADDIVSLVAKLRQEFGDAKTTVESPTQPEVQSSGFAEPALPIDKAVTHDKVFCLCCGKGFKMLKRHLGAEHNLTEAAYRAKFGLPEDMPLVAPSYSARKASYAKKVGFGKYDRLDPQSSRAGIEEDQKTY